MDGPSAPADAATELELSVVIPCLNEAETLGVCIEKAFEGIAAAGTPNAPLGAEVIVADNGSTDGSREIAEELGARVVPVNERGYGAALMGGIEAARGRFVIMGDADDSYDFREVPRFVEKLREGFDLVQGCRLPSGGGTIEEGAMPWSHRWIGNPLFSLLVRRWFKAPIHDVYCGLRGFTKALYLRLEQQCTGMEFATEMIIKASLRAERIAEIPITLRRDGRTLREPHLRTVKDGWRTLRFFLLFSPRWLFLAPGLFAILLGLVGYAVAWPGWIIGGVRFDAHTLLFASLAILCGTQAVWFALCAKTYAINEGLLPQDERLERFYGWATLERGVALAGVAIVAATGLLIAAIAQWSAVDFGDLDYARTMRLVIPGATLFALGVQAGLSSFFISMLGLSRRRG
jgi:glycosyltransferase involved in cell wall biosynthesis